MHVDSIREALRKQPFEPFTIRLADGRSEFVRHPEFVAVGPRVVVVVRDNSSWSSIEPMLIASLDCDGGKRKRGNGSRKKKPKA